MTTASVLSIISIYRMRMKPLPPGRLDLPLNPEGFGGRFAPFLYLLSGMTSSPMVLRGQGHLPPPSPSRKGCGGRRSRHPDRRQKISALTPKEPGTPAARWAPAPARVRPTCCGGAARDWGSGFVRAIGTVAPLPGCPQPALPRAAPRGLSTSPSRLQPPPKPGQSPGRATATGGSPPRPAQTCLAAPPPGLVPCGS